MQSLECCIYNAHFTFLLIMYHYVYQTKNLINGKTYIGVHSTKRVNDTYIGHGIYRQTDAERMIKNGSKSLLVRAVCKHGYNNFKREILCFFDTREEALMEESFLVDDNWVLNKNNYNTLNGGLGINLPPSKEHLKKLAEISSREYVVSNLDTKEVWFVKNLSDFERKRYKEFNHKNDGKKIACRLHSISDGKSLIYKNKWWACLKDKWDGSIPLKEDLIKKRKENRKPFSNNDPNRYANRTYEHVAKSNRNRSKTYEFLSPDGEYYKVEHLPTFCKEFGLSPANMCKVNKGVYKTHKGWTKAWNC